MPEVPEVITQSQKRFKLCEDAERATRLECLDDLRFRAGDQWTQESRNRRKAKSQPCLTLNVLPTRERQILNDRRRNRNAIDVHPVDDKADIETAKTIKGMVRHIEYDSNADVAYDRADASAVRIGFGFIDIVTQYEDNESNNQVIKIESVRNPFQRYIDPSSQEPDGSDANFGFKFYTYTKDDYLEEFPDSELATASLADWAGIGDKDPDWLSNDGVRICHYYYKEIKKDKLLYIELKDGKKFVKKSAYPNSKIATFTVETDGEKIKQQVLQLEDETEIPILQVRDIKIETIKCCKHNAVEILEETEWPGDPRWIPIIPVYGDEIDVDGERKLEGMIRHAKDAIRMENYMASAQVQVIQLAPNSPWQAAEGTIEGYEKIYETANVDMPAILPYKLKTIGNELAPAPSRLVQEPAIRAITEARLQFADDLKSITGINDAQLGRTSNEKSGLAINARKQQGELANFHFADNSRRSQRHVGRIIIGLIPKIYDVERVTRIIGDDNIPSTVKLNQPITDATGEPKLRKDGSQQIFDVRVGTYDVVVDSGPSADTKREENMEAMQGLVTAEPALLGIAGDLIVGQMDFPAAKDVAARIKKTLPPNLQDDEDKPQSNPQDIQKIQQYGQLIDQLTAHVNEQSEMIKAKTQELQSKEKIADADRASKERIAAYQGQVQLDIKSSTDANAAAIATLTEELGHIHELMGHQRELMKSALEHRKLDVQQQQADQQNQLKQTELDQKGAIAADQSDLAREQMEQPEPATA